VGDYRVESDWSGASYWYAMALLEEHARLRLSFLKNESLQGDSALVNIFHGLGLLSEFRQGQLVLTRLARIHPGIFSYDFTNSPDIVQSMAVALCMAGIPFRFTGTQTLRIKETDRILALQNELKKLGFVLETDKKGSFLAWNKQYCEPDPDPVIATYHDHRMAMAFAPVALSLGHIRIQDPLVVTKSYPQFWEHLEKAGFRVEKEV
jgi:3-phosphoshikimate 1-carboxyvinyltransferase